MVELCTEAANALDAKDAILAQAGAALVDILARAREALAAIGAGAEEA